MVERKQRTEVEVVLPENPPVLTPRAARLLLQIIQDAAAKEDADEA